MTAPVVMAIPYDVLKITNLATPPCANSLRAQVLKRRLAALVSLSFLRSSFSRLPLPFPFPLLQFVVAYYRQYESSKLASNLPLVWQPAAKSLSQDVPISGTHREGI